MATTWIVLLEAEGDESRKPMDQATLQEFMATMETEGVIAVHSPHRYALQLQIESDSAAAAVFTVTSRWEAMVRGRGFSDWRLQRLELITPEEFARDLASADGIDLPCLEGNQRTQSPLVLLQGGLGGDCRTTARKRPTRSPLSMN